MRDPWFYKFARPIIKGFMFLVYRPKIEGIENIPKKSDGPIVLAGNHTNNFDCLLLISSTKRCIHFLAKHTLYKGAKKIIFKNMGIIPVNRSEKNKEAVDIAEQILTSGGTIGIFPEGTINRTNDIIMPFKIGAVKMAYETDATIVPFSITGEYKLFKNDLKIKFDKPYKISNNDLDIENKILMEKVILMLKEGK